MLLIKKYLLGYVSDANNDDELTSGWIQFNYINFTIIELSVNLVN